MNPEGDQCLCMVRELDFNGTSGIYWDIFYSDYLNRAECILKLVEEPNISNCCLRCAASF